jgi:flagellar biosynthesis component FlhA
LGQILNKSTLTTLEETDELDEQITNRVHDVLNEEEMGKFIDTLKKYPKKKARKAIVEEEREFSLESVVNQLANEEISYKELDDAIDSLKKKKKGKAKKLVEKLEKKTSPSDTNDSTDNKTLKEVMENIKIKLSAPSANTPDVIESTAKYFIRKLNSDNDDENEIDITGIVDFKDVADSIEQEKEDAENKLRATYYIVNKLKKVSKKKGKKVIIKKKGKNRKHLIDELKKLYDQYIDGAVYTLDQSIINEVRKLISE